MSIRPRHLALLSLAVILAGCTASFPNRSRSIRTDGGVRSEDGAIILTGIALDERRGTVLDAIQGTVPGVRILKHRDGQCPQIYLRHHVTFETQVNPMVYVDGTRTVDTCILDQIRTTDVESVEVYPMGVTTRAGYATHAHGLILVFMRGAGG